MFAVARALLLANGRGFHTPGPRWDIWGQMNVGGRALAEKPDKQLTKQIGEHLVVAQLGRRGIIAAPLAGNVRDIDILAYKDGQTLPIQVKSMRQPSGSVNAMKYLTISLDRDDQRQGIRGPLETIDRTLIFVVVMIGETTRDDRFFVFEQGALQDTILRRHTDVLFQCDGHRKKNWESTHCSYDPREFVGAEDSWSLIDQKLSKAGIAFRL
jgi:hypothetical protein